MMTFFHVATVLRQPQFNDLHPTSRLILAILADMANEHGECRPSREFLAERAGVSLETIKRQLKHLRELGHISSQRSTLINVYRLHLPAWGGGTVTRSVPAPEAIEATPGDAPEPNAPVEHLEAAPGDSSERILLSDAARLIQSCLPSVAWELGETATIKEVAYRLKRLDAIGLSARKIRELTADWPDFVQNPPAFVISQLQRLEMEHAGSRMDSRQAQRQADQVKRLRLTDRELAEERDRQRRRREQILKTQEAAIVSREEAEKHERLQREAEEAAAEPPQPWDDLPLF